MAQIVERDKVNVNEGKGPGLDPLFGREEDSR
jgi:hypothetical protein